MLLTKESLNFGVFKQHKDFMNYIFYIYKNICLSSAKYYQNNKERLQKKFVKDMKVFKMKKKKKSNNVVMINSKIY